MGVWGKVENEVLKKKSIIITEIIDVDSLKLKFNYLRNYIFISVKSATDKT